MPYLLSPDLVRKMHAYWRAANYLSVGQIYLQDNPLLESPLRLEHIKPRLLGHWGTTPGLRRKMIECIFGWGKQHGTMRKTKHRGVARVAGGFFLNLIAYNLIRIPKLVAA